MAKKASRAQKTVMPEIIAFVACDAISRDPSSGKISLYGLFDTIWVESFPATFKPFSVFAKLTGKRRLPLTINMVPPRGKPQQLGKLDVNFKRGGTAEIHLSIAGLELKHAGQYKVVLEARGKPVGRPCTLVVKRRTKQN